MRFLVAEKLGPHKFKTPEGYLICTDAILSRTGKQEYKRCELFGDTCEDPDKIVNIERTDDEVFSDKAMASFENKAVCIEHPDHDVNAENHNELAVGFVRDIHKGEDNGKPVMMGTLVITDKDAVEAVESGEYKELSCGYDCDIDDDDNPQQRNIRGNHVALCKHGRAGIARIVDSVDDARFWGQQYPYELWLTYPKTGRKFMAGAFKTHEEARRNTDRLRKEFTHNVDGIPNAEIRENFRDSVDDAGIKVWQVRQGYAIVVKRYWQQYGKNAFVDATESSIEAARYHRGSLERNDKMDFVIIDCNDGKYKIEDSEMKDIQSTKAPGTDKIIYVMQSDIDKNLYFYIGKTFSMKEGSWGYTKFEMGDDTPEKIKAELARNGWHQVASGPARIIDASNEEWTVVEEENYKKANKAVIDEEYVQLPRGRFKVVEKTKEELEREGYGYHHSANGYSVYTKNNTAVAIKDAVKDAKTEYVFNWHDTYHGTKDKTRVDANSIKEAIKKFGDLIALGGIGTANCYVVSISPNDGYLRTYGKLSDLLKTFYDSVKSATQDNKERLFTIEYKQGDTMYVRKVHANSIEDAISKVKDLQPGVMTKSEADEVLATIKANYQRVAQNTWQEGLARVEQWRDGYWVVSDKVDFTKFARFIGPKYRVSKTVITKNE